MSANLERCPCGGRRSVVESALARDLRGRGRRIPFHVVEALGDDLFARARIRRCARCRSDLWTIERAIHDTHKGA